MHIGAKSVFFGIGQAKMGVRQMLPTGDPLEKIGDQNSGAKGGWYCRLLLCGKLEVVKSDKCFIGKKAGKMGEKCCMPGHNKSATG